MRRHKISITTLLACAVGVVSLAVSPSSASPLGGQQTAGQCRLVTLHLTTVGANTQISADPGTSLTCTEFDASFLTFVRQGGLTVVGLVGSCTGNASDVHADVMFIPAGRVDSYDAHLNLRAVPGTNVVAATLISSGLTPHVIGTGTFVKSAASTCSQATWTLGTITYEDPTFG